MTGLRLAHRGSSAAAIAAAAAAALSVNSTGAGNRSTTASTTPSTQWTHEVVAGDDRRIFGMVGCTHDNWLSTYTTPPNISSSIDGTFSVIASIMIGDASGFRQGGVALVELLAPSIGTHTMTASMTAAQNIAAIAGNTRCYDNVGGRSSAVTQAQTSSSAALNLSLTPTAEEIALIVGIFNTAPTLTGALSGETPWYSAGAAVAGDGDYLRAVDVAGTGAAQSYTTSGTHKLGGIAIVIQPT